MEAKNILGLDLGTNSIGWAMIERDFDNKTGKILGMGSRIIPMDQSELNDFGKGNSISQTAERTRYRSARRIRERHLLRRERLHRVLNVLGFLPDHYASEIDFSKRLGQFKDGKEPKLIYNNGSFLFRNSFEEMLEDFRQHQPALLVNKNGEPALIPYAWTIYYLRKKALTRKIEKEELAWILLNFNQKRGYYQLRGEEEEEIPNKLVEFHSLKVVDVIADEAQKGKADISYSLVLENGWIYRRPGKTPLFDWKDKVRDFIVTTDLNDDGTVKTDKEGKEKRSFRAPGDTDWTLLKKKTEQEIDNSQKTVGAYIYDALLKNPSQKIKGKLVRTIERKYYKQELELILRKQLTYHPELQNEDNYNACIKELYRNNDMQQQLLDNKDFVYLFIEDIIFYQRPLRSKKSLIGNCSLEYYTYKDKDGMERRQFLKAIAKSNPYYQEYRIWQWMSNLSIYQKENDLNVTYEFLNSLQDWEHLFEFLDERKEIEQKSLIRFLLSKKGLKGKALTGQIDQYRWNYVEDKEYPCNKTKTMLRSRLEKVTNIPTDFLTRNIEQSLWHLIYSVTDKNEYEQALRSFASKYKLDKGSFVDSFRKFPLFEEGYGSFSEKAIKKLLPLMRTGKYWNWNMIDRNSQHRIESILTGEYDESIKTRVREKAKHLNNENDFQGLPLWLAQYIVYGRHSEAANMDHWDSADDLTAYLKEFRQHSLRNPIVEQVVTETLRVVRDIWIKYGNGAGNYFDEIHIELGRDMKNSADDRKKLTEVNLVNENTNMRIKALLVELKSTSGFENVRPYSPTQQEILKLYEEGVLNSDIELPDDILKISKTAQPSSQELQRYTLWLEQKYRSPYTGAVIPLNKLFTPEYEIEHIIPQSRYFDDSFSNKVICEAAINRLKDNQIGLEFIKNHHGQKVETGMGGSVQVSEVAEYENFVKQHYAKTKGKRNKLLMEEIPEKMIERQLNDTRYISKFISGLLSHIVREKTNDDGVNSKNIIPCNGKITTRLKQDWGLNDVWNDIILPRFERMNQLTNSTHFTAWNENHQKYLPSVPLALSKGFSKKRIDHRHHALDALVIACATRDHVNLLNNQSANSETKRYDLQNKLRRRESYFNEKEQKQRNVFKEFHKPWDTFTQDARKAMEHIIVSIKQNQRVINKTTNRYVKYQVKDGIREKVIIEQEGVNWAIRKPMHKGMVYGKVNLYWIKAPKSKLLTAKREPLNPTFDLKAIASITDTGIQKILTNYLAAKNNQPEIAFSPEGIEDLNKNIRQYNAGKDHKPIYNVRVFESGTKFALGNYGNKKDKYVEAEIGTNLFFAVYSDEKGKRLFETIPLNVVIEHQKWRATLSENEQRKTPMIPVNAAYGHLLFFLSPNDLVYVPTEDEYKNINKINFTGMNKDQVKRIFVVNNFTDKTCFFTPIHLAKHIASKEVDLRYDHKAQKVLGSFDTKTGFHEGIQIREICIKLNVDRLGNIQPSVNEYLTGSPLIQNSEVNESGLDYSTNIDSDKNIYSFDSLQEQEADNFEWLASLTPEQHIRNATELIKRIFSEQLKKNPHLGHHLTFE